MNLQNLNPSYIVGPEGERKSVILSIEDFEELLEELEDLSKLAARLNEPTVSHEEVLRELTASGIV